MDVTLGKADFIRIFQSVMGRIEAAPGQSILEVGAGTGWAGCLLKKCHPECRVVISDISPLGLEKSCHFEKWLGVRLDGKWACRAQQTPFPDASFDRVFSFASFHHFGTAGDFSTVLVETVRLLKPDGFAVFFYETNSPRWLYGILRYRALRERRHEVDEDVLRVGRLRRQVRDPAWRLAVEYAPTHRYRSGLLVANYMYALGKIPFLKRLLPCTVHLFLRGCRRPPDLERSHPR